jgi:hypothetical protein
MNARSGLVRPGDGVIVDGTRGIVQVRRATRV